MIDYETFCKIHDCHDRQGLTVGERVTGASSGTRTRVRPSLPGWRAQLDRKARRRTASGGTLAFADQLVELGAFLRAQPAVLIGLIAHIVGTPLQDDIARTTDRLLRLGQDILATSTVRATDAARA